MTPFDWDEYLEFAEEQVRRVGNPAAERSAISRAYYAVFHTAKRHYLQDGEPLTLRAEDHGRVAKWYQGSERHELRQIGKWLEWLRKKRREADYEDIFPDLSWDAQAAVIRAREAINAISRLR